MNDIDKRLLEQIKGDNRIAFETLHKKYYQPLCNFAFSYVKSIDFAEEVVSDVFLNIWMKRDSIKISTSIKAYLYISAKNQSINFLKSQKQKFEEIEKNGYEYEASENDTDAQLIYHETLSQVEKIINKLPPQRQTIFRLNRIDGLKYKEIAKVLSISVYTVQKQMIEAVKQISKSYPGNNSVLFSIIKKAFYD